MRQDIIIYAALLVNEIMGVSPLFKNPAQTIPDEGGSTFGLIQGATPARGNNQ